jgi:hypothetical protein
MNAQDTISHRQTVRYSKCIYCNGRGYSSICYKCRGTGVVTKLCVTCKGSGVRGYHPCLACKGMRETQYTCYTCGGTGVGFKCIHCYGRGIIKKGNKNNHER